MATRPRAGLLIPAVTGTGRSWWLALGDAARAADVDLVTFAGQELDRPDDFRAQANAIYELAGARRLDGLIVCTAALGRYSGPDYVSAFCRRFGPLPLVSIGQDLPGRPSVGHDVRAGMRVLVDHLVDRHGYRRIAFAGAQDDPRYLGYRDALAAHRIGLTAGADAVVAADVPLGRAALAGGVPVVSFAGDEADGAGQLTTARTPVRAIAARALDLFTAAVRGDPVAVAESVVSELVVRGSCGCPPGADPPDAPSGHPLDEVVRQLGQRLVTALDVGELTDVLTRYLPDVGLPTCYVVLYDPVPPEGEPPPSWSRLLFAYEHGRRATTARGRRFPSDALLPDPYFFGAEPRDLVVLPLYFKNQHLGAVVFEGMRSSSWVYEALQGQIASAVEGGILLRRERHALAAVEEGRRELERRVAERTAELARANAELREEMAVRQRAEETKARLEEQLRQSQKMEAVGRLAGGVAHDFNNLLVLISGYSEMMLDALEPGSPWREEVEEIARAGQRAAALTRQLLVFSRQQVVQPRVVDLNTVVENLDRMLRRIIGDEIEVVTVLAAAQPIRADVGQLEQIVVNLAVNARDAMPGGGRLTIETGDVQVDEAYAAARIGVAVGPYVTLRVTDNGIGMDEATQALIFEPFFTTKPPGRGTGLGLATVFGIVSQSGGHIRVDSAPGHGTQFTVFLPAVTVPAEPAAPQPAADTDAAIDGSETVLLVEDDARVRAAIRTFMSRHGYQVIEAADGDEALRLCENHPGPFDIVVSDVRMPGLRGTDLARRVASLRPNTPILFISGYTDSTPVLDCLSDPMVALLQKPFSAEVLARKVRQMLSARRFEP